MRRACLAAIVFCLLAGTAAARDIFVDNIAGDDKNVGQHPRGTNDRTGPVRTIGKALRLTDAGDRVVLAKNDEPYHESVSLSGTRNSGSAPLTPFILEGSGATLDGASPIPADAWRHYRDNVFSFRPKSLIRAVLVYHGEVIRGLPLPQGTGLPPRLEPMQWCAAEGAIYFAVQRDKLPPDYKLRYADLPTGITLYQVHQTVIRNLTIKRFQADGVSAGAAARDVVLEHVISADNGQCGVRVNGGAQVAIDGCKLSGNGESQLTTCANSETHLLSSTLLDDSAPGWVDQGGRVFLGTERINGGRREIK